MQENYRLDSILGVCDAKHLLSQLEAKREKSCVNEASEQVAFSDRLLLTKTDLCSEMEINGVLQHLTLGHGLDMCFPFSCLCF